ncbi:leucine-rich repeat domain-containing protein [Skeletonema marinoi]|uniref:Leucine-rich repeat domain-containing protein n=1 Tax=Skeletonema marinoi TaxID=267567 RepID=A0AAD9D8V1_9STRA|nr:leucine-rich repeat domain-containing protein [Skeletonema marinoi]
MADHADDGDDVFVYMGGRAPQHVTRVRIDKSVEVIEENAFRDCENLVQVETHDGIRRVGERAFNWCNSLRRINLKYVVEIGVRAFWGCTYLESVEFGNKLETIGRYAFEGSISIKYLKLPSVITIGMQAFCNCKALIDIEFSERLETIETRAFAGCDRIERIAIPLKRGLFVIDDLFFRYNQFDNCGRLRTVDLVAGAHTKTATSLHMQCWRNEMQEEINRINQVLPNTPDNNKAEAIIRWIGSVLNKMEHYKAEHCRYVKEAVTLLELALWKAKLGEKEEKSVEERAKKAKIDVESARKERRITCGADIVIKNVLPFLKLVY